MSHTSHNKLQEHWQLYEDARMHSPYCTEKFHSLERSDLLELMKHKGAELAEESTLLYKGQPSFFGRRVLALNSPVEGTS